MKICPWTEFLHVDGDTTLMTSLELESFSGFSGVVPSAEFWRSGSDNKLTEFFSFLSLSWCQAKGWLSLRCLNCATSVSSNSRAKLLLLWVNFELWKWMWNLFCIKKLNEYWQLNYVAVKIGISLKQGTMGTLTIRRES